MKFTLISILMLGFMSTAHATPTPSVSKIKTYNCEKNLGLENEPSYRLRLSLSFPSGTPGSSGLLMVPGEATPHSLTCGIPAESAGPTEGADLYHTIAFCNDGIADAGYSVSLQSGGFVGWTIAEVEIKSLIQNKIAARLICESKDSQ